MKSNSNLIIMERQLLTGICRERILDGYGEVDEIAGSSQSEGVYCRGL